MAELDKKTLMARFPEMNLRPASEFKIPLLFFNSRVDYVEQINNVAQKDRFLRIAKNGKFGILHWKIRFFKDSANIIIPCQYDYIYPEDNGIFKAVKKGETFYLDKIGKRLT